MSVVLRLAKVGKRGTRMYRVVAVDRKRKRDSMPLEILGFYLESKTNPVIKIKKERVAYWKEKGANVSYAVQKLLGEFP